jgi:glycosyltransferase involved in cell wall biosynthesis
MSSPAVGSRVSADAVSHTPKATKAIAPGRSSITARSGTGTSEGSQRTHAHSSIDPFSCAAGVATTSRFRGKRAAVIVFSYYPADPRPRREAEALVSQGMIVELICIRQSKDEPTRESFNGVEILRVPMKRRRGGKFAYLFQYSSFTLISFVLLAFRSLTRRYDLVHVHNMPDTLVFSALIPKLFGAKVILDLHDPMPELMMTISNLRKESLAVGILKRFEKWSIKFADLVLTVNLACRTLFASRSCSVKKIRVIMNSPDETIFGTRLLARNEPLRRDTAKPFVIMYHGCLVERHGLDLAVRALKTVRKSIPTAELRVYGNRTPFLDQVMDSVREWGLQDAVHYLGGKSLEEIVEAIGDCDLGIIPNRRSIFTEINTPTRIFEYLTQGKPVIAPRAQGIQDYFSEQSLIYFDLGDADDLARKIEYVFANPCEVADTVIRGQEIYLDHKWSTEKEGFLDIVGELLSPDASRSYGLSKSFKPDPAKA